MSDSLKQKLVDLIQANAGQVVPNERIYKLCIAEGYKISNAERRLRELRDPKHQSFNPHIQAERYENGTIKGYYWKFEVVCTCCPARTVKSEWWLDPKIDPRLTEKKVTQLALL